MGARVDGASVAGDRCGGREDIANVRITVGGNGAHTTAAAFGSATLR